MVVDDVEDDDVEDDDGEVGNVVDVVEVDEVAGPFVVGLGVVVEVIAAEVDVEPSAEVVDGTAATAAGVSPTWESARLTICHVSTVATTSATTQAAAILHEIMA